MVAILEGYFKKMKVVRGKFHKFSGIKITYQDNSRFRINIKLYLEVTEKKFTKV